MRVQYILIYAACPWNSSDSSNQTYYDDVYRKCTLECPSNPSRYKSYSTTTRRCLKYCEAGYYALDTTRECVSNCPNYYFINNTLDTTEYRCVARCPNNTFINSSTDKHCVKSQNCPSGQWGNPWNGQCVTHCPSSGGVQLFADMNPNVKMCVYYCPKNYYIQNETNNWKCVSDCTGVANRFIDYISMKCVQNCPNGTFAYSNGTCLTKCPTNSYGDPFLNKCDSTCTGNYFTDPTTQMCVPVCPYGYFGDKTAGYHCYQTCSVAT